MPLCTDTGIRTATDRATESALRRITERTRTLERDGAFAIGSMISPFLVGLLADRYFASEKLLAVFSLVGGAVLCVLPSRKSFMPFYSTLILYCALFTPTLALGNSLALTHLQDAKTAFPRVKLWLSLIHI